MSTKQRGMLWIVILVFAVMVFNNAGTVLWGSLGVFRPGDPGVTATTLPRKTAEAVISSLQMAHLRMWQTLVAGTIALFVVAMLPAKPSKVDGNRSQSTT